MNLSCFSALKALLPRRGETMPFRRRISSASRNGLATALLSLIAVVSHAASINWSAIQNILGDADVSLNGTLVAAFNFNGRATTVNTVTFLPFAVGGPGPGTFMVGDYTIESNFFGAFSDTGSMIPQFTALTSDYQLLLGTAVKGISDQKLTLGGLTIGEQYEFQTWANDPENSFGTKVGDSANFANSVLLDQGSAGRINPYLGQYVLGTFTANAVTQEVFIGVDEVSAVNGFQLRRLSPNNVPEAGVSILMVAVTLAGTGKIAYHRHRRKKEKSRIWSDEPWNRS